MKENALWEIICSLISQNIKSLNDISPKFFAFQDSIIITLNVKKIDNRDEFLLPFCTLVQHYLANSFINKILFRGAFSIGEFYHHKENFYFGEAINDASNYYEALDLIGVMSTPNTTKYLDQFVEKNKNLGEIGKDTLWMFNNLLGYTNELPVKLQPQAGYLSNWPLVLAFIGLRPHLNIDPSKNAYEVFTELILSYTYPENARLKYYHTRIFAKQLFETYPGYLNVLRPDGDNYDDIKGLLE